MGVAESPLRDRVIYVEGVPRSGTTMLVALFSTHPDVAGIGTESHLFDDGVGQLFDNHEAAGQRPHQLGDYLSRETLLDLVRDLADGVLEEMRAQVKPGAQMVVEKTPIAEAGGRQEVVLARKRECYPDAWYVHIVRDEDAVATSLARSPLMSDRSLAAGKDLWRRSVRGIRAALGDHDRYREVRYEQLARDPVRVMADLFEWLGLECDAALEEVIAARSQERFADFGPVEELPGSPSPDTPEASAPTGAAEHGLRARLRRSSALAPVRRLRAAWRSRDSRALGNAFARAFREGDQAAIEALTTPDFELTVRCPGVGVQEKRDSARAELAEIGRRLFAERFFSEVWGAAGRGPLATVIFTGMRAGAERVDFSLTVSGRRRVGRALLISDSDLTGSNEAAATGSHRRSTERAGSAVNPGR